MSKRESAKYKIDRRGLDDVVSCPLLFRRAGGFLDGSTRLRSIRRLVAIRTFSLRDDIAQSLPGGRLGAVCVGARGRGIRQSHGVSRGGWRNVARPPRVVLPDDDFLGRRGGCRDGGSCRCQRFRSSRLSFFHGGCTISRLPRIGGLYFRSGRYSICLRPG